MSVFDTAAMYLCSNNIKAYESVWLHDIVDVFQIFLYDEDYAMSEMDASFLDDGTSWDEGVFHKKEFSDIVICHAIHALWDHQCYSAPDILRMENFESKIKLDYENEECPQLEINDDEQRKHQDGRQP